MLILHLIRQGFGPVHPKYLLGWCYYRPHTKYGARKCFHRRVSFCLQGAIVHPGCNPGGCNPLPEVWFPRSMHHLSKVCTTPGCTPPQRQTVNRRAVRILLDCILVDSLLFTMVESLFWKFIMPLDIEKATASTSLKPSVIKSK